MDIWLWFRRLGGWLLMLEVAEKRCDAGVADRVAVLAESSGERIAGEREPVPAEFVPGHASGRQKRGRALSSAGLAAAGDKDGC